LNTVIKFWQESEWVWQVCIIFFFITIVLVPLEAFVSLIIFTDISVEYRSMFGVRNNRNYSDITRLFQDTHFLAIQFEDKKKVKIWRSQGDLGMIVSIIQKYASKKIPVVSTFQD